jgi:hypothetical protein
MFPQDWPEGCPPSEAADASGEVYRVVRYSPPTRKDFTTHHEAGKMPKAPPCLRAGLSVLRGLVEAQHQRALMPHLGPYIARATLEQKHGKTQLTQGKVPTHTTWWPYENGEREALFALVVEQTT